MALKQRYEPAETFSMEEETMQVLVPSWYKHSEEA